MLRLRTGVERVRNRLMRECPPIYKPVKIPISKRMTNEAHEFHNYPTNYIAIAIV